MPLERRVAPSFPVRPARRARGPFARSALVVILAAGAHAGLGAEFTVNSTADAVDANAFDSLCATATGACTLRAAIQQANASNVTGGTTIHLPAGTYALTLAGTDEDASATGDLDLLASNGVTIAGAGPSSTHIDANGIDRVLDIRAFANATISGLSITGGTAAEGGGIRNNGTAAIVDVSINGNGAAAGGGIYNTAIMGVTGGNVGFNAAQGNPGNGGGIYNAGSLTLENATIPSNQAYGHGGGVYNGPAASASLESVTIAGNAADAEGDGSGDGGGVYNDPSMFGSGILDFQNTLIANNTDFPSGTPVPDCYSIAGMTSLGYNLVRDTTSCVVTGGSTDITGVDPLLQPLATNGGTSGNMALGAGSPALDAGNPDAPESSAGACPATDQRGVSRPMDGDGNGVERCDIGAFELVPSVNLSITKTDSPDPIAISSSLTYTITVTNNGSVPAIGVVVTDPLPSGVTFSSASTGCVHSGGTVTCTFGNIAAGANAHEDRRRHSDDGRQLSPRQYGDDHGRPLREHQPGHFRDRPDDDQLGRRLRIRCRGARPRQRGRHPHLHDHPRQRGTWNGDGRDAHRLSLTQRHAERGDALAGELFGNDDRCMRPRDHPSGRDCDSDHPGDGPQAGRHRDAVRDDCGLGRPERERTTGSTCSPPCWHRPSS